MKNLNANTISSYYLQNKRYQLGRHMLNSDTKFPFDWHQKECLTLNLQYFLAFPEPEWLQICLPTKSTLEIAS